MLRAQVAVASMNSPYLYVDEGKLLLNIDRRLKFIVELIPGRSWNASAGCWQVPPRPENVSVLKAKIPNLVVFPEVMPLILHQSQKEQAVAAEKDIPWQEAKPIEPMPLRAGVVPFQHQTAAYNVTCQILGVFKSDRKI